MKTIKQHFNQVSFMLSFLILIHGCTIYKSVPITLEQAAQKEHKVKVITKNNEKLIFEYIRFDNGQYYGVTKRDKAMFQVPLEEYHIRSINLKNKTISTISGIVGFLTVLTVFSGIILIIEYPWLIVGL